MKRVFKLFKRIMAVLISIVVLVLIIGFVFIRTSPQFGGSHSKDDVERFHASGHYKEGKFINQIPTKLDYSFKNMVAILKQYWKGNPQKSPDHELPVMKLDTANWSGDTIDRLLWFGHSAFLLQIDDKNVLIDPMLGQSPSPHPLIGTKRYSDKLPAEIEDLPQIDLIVISHDHYDHLDYGSIKKLKAKTTKFLVPLGVGAHLQSWGVEKEKIEEFNWWDETRQAKLDLAFLPAQHFSGRGLSDNSSTLWGSWVIKGEKTNIYFSGDGGYGPHFKEIGAKYGPFDFAMMECGQYNKLWSEIHMMPEETIQAAIDVKSQIMMPIHWGAFTLALHDWNEPVIRASKKANELNMPMIVPKIGEIIYLDSIASSSRQWW